MTSRREFLSSAAAFAALPVWSEVAPRQASVGVAPWEMPDSRASAGAMVRRLYLDLAGRLPTADEAQSYVGSNDPAKKAALVERLLASEDFADYWSMRFCDLLRVKSEFPINLWPNAVYVYHRRIREAIRTDESWDHFARALITATGSNFRDAESNFLRASADRSPAGLARMAVRTFLNEDLETWSAAERAEAVACFSAVRFKSTREWKEELVYTDGADRRIDFVEMLLTRRRASFERALPEYVGRWMLNRSWPEKGFDLKTLCRSIALSDAYACGSVTGGFPCRRLDAEVLEDTLASLFGFKRDYRSIAPEPFTFLPSERKSVLIEDGSISSSFLTLFGRPPRDSGLMDERHGEVTAKQRLFLMNSARLYNRLGSVNGTNVELYWKLFSRAPTEAERRIVKESKHQRRDLVWCLVNTREFLYRT